MVQAQAGFLKGWNPMIVQDICACEHCAGFRWARCSNGLSKGTAGEPTSAHMCSGTISTDELTAHLQSFRQAVSKHKVLQQHHNIYAHLQACMRYQNATNIDLLNKL